MTTPRLDLVASALEHLRCELESPKDLGDLLEAAVPASWPPGEYDRGAMEFFRARLEEGGPAVLGWYGWYAIRRADADSPRSLVGSGGYFGPPDPEGVVEIGFSVTPEWRRRGFAQEIVAALVEGARREESVKLIIAHADSGNFASRAVLERNGFRQVGSGNEPGSLRFECAPGD